MLFLWKHTYYIYIKTDVWDTTTYNLLDDLHFAWNKIAAAFCFEYYYLRAGFPLWFPMRRRLTAIQREKYMFLVLRFAIIIVSIVALSSTSPQLAVGCLLELTSLYLRTPSVDSARLLSDNKQFVLGRYDLKITFIVSLGLCENTREYKITSVSLNMKPKLSVGV